MRGLAEDSVLRQNQITRVLVCDRTDYLLEAEKHLSDSNTYKEVKISDHELVKLVERSNIKFKRNACTFHIIPKSEPT